MGYERDGRGDPQRDRYGREQHEAGYSSERDYERPSYGRQEQDYRRQEQGYGQRDRMSQGYGDQNRDEWRSQGRAGGGNYGRGDDSRRSHGSDDRGRDTYRQQQGSTSTSRGTDDDRGFLNRAGDEVRSWFGDEEAERRRESDAHRDGQAGGSRDDHYHSWRNQQIQSFDRDYSEYRQGNQSRFHNEFASFRTERQGQRDLLNGVEEHAEVVGSDGEHVGTVDKVRGDRIILTKSDQDAGGRHHSIPSRWLQSADGTKVVLRKTASEAKAHWRDEERQGTGENPNAGSMSSERGEQSRSNQDGSSTSGTNLNRSFSGTY